ncbi:Uncharacterized protein XB15_01144 [Leptospira santarosai]|nr:Uncharacterized protein XB15_01144 [Leptospira santarosai]
MSFYYIFETEVCCRIRTTVSFPEDAFLKITIAHFGIVPFTVGKKGRDCVERNIRNNLKNTLASFKIPIILGTFIKSKDNKQP